MTNTRLEMMNKVSQKWGLEHEYTIEFCGMAEDDTCPDRIVNGYFDTVMAIQNYEDED